MKKKKNYPSFVLWFFFAVIVIAGILSSDILKITVLSQKEISENPSNYFVNDYPTSFTYNENESNLLLNQEYELLFFSSAWCGPCSVVQSRLIEYAPKIQKTKIYKVELESRRDIAEKYKVNFVPTIILLGEKEIKRLEGFDNSQLDNLLKYVESLEK